MAEPFFEHPYLTGHHAPVRFEADGYAMTLVHPANSSTTELAIFRAEDIAAEPIARVDIPFRVPSGFHCNFYASDNRFLKQAIQ